MQTNHKFTVFPIQLNIFIARYIEGDEEVEYAVCVDSLPSAKQKIRAHLESLLKELENLKMRDIV